MTKPIVTLIVARIVTEAPWSISAPEVGGAIDKPLSTTGDGHTVWVPATSLAGSLREHLRAHGLDETLLGPELPASDEDRTGDEVLSASPLRLVGTRVSNSPGEIVHRQTAISRGSGAAKAKTLRATRLGESGSVVELFMRFEAAASISVEHLDTICTWTPRLGGGASAAFGKARLDSLKYGTLDLDSRAGLRAWLTQSGPALFEAVTTQACKVGAHQRPPLFDATLRIADGLLVQGGRTAAQVAAGRGAPDAVPLRWQGSLVVPGTSLRGVLRSRCEFIVRSCGVDACGAGGTSPGLGCGICPVCEIFGSTASRGRIAIESSTVEQACETDSPHVAIDRVSGGASDRLLFKDRAITRGSVQLTIRIIGPTDSLPVWAHGLLLMALRDIHDGFVAVGSRGSRGLGSLEFVTPAVLENPGALAACRDYLRQRRASA